MHHVFAKGDGADSAIRGDIGEAMSADRFLLNLNRLRTGGAKAPQVGRCEGELRQALPAYTNRRAELSDGRNRY